MIPTGLIIAAVSALSEPTSVAELKRCYLNARSNLVAGEYFVRCKSFSIEDGKESSSGPWSSHVQFDHRKSWYRDELKGKFRRSFYPGPWLVDCRMGFTRSETRVVQYSTVDSPKHLPQVLIGPTTAVPMMCDLHFDVRTCGLWFREHYKRMQWPEAANQFVFDSNRFRFSQDDNRITLTKSFDKPRLEVAIQFRKKGFVPILVRYTLDGKETYRCETKWQLKDDVFVPVKILVRDEDRDGAKRVQQMLIRWKSTTTSGLTADPTKLNAQELGITSDELRNAIARNNRRKSK